MKLIKELQNDLNIKEAIESLELAIHDVEQAMKTIDKISPEFYNQIAERRKHMLNLKWELTKQFNGFITFADQKTDMSNYPFEWKEDMGK